MNYKRDLIKMAPWMALSFLIFLSIQLVNLIPAYIMSFIVDVVIPSGDWGKTVFYIILFVAIPLLAGAGSSYYVYVTAIKCRQYAYGYNRRIFENLLSQDMTFLTANSGNELSSKAMQEISDYVYLWICTIPQAAASVLAGIVTVVVIGNINLTVAILQLLFIIALIIPAKCSGKLVKKNSKLLFGAIIKGRAIVAEAFNGVRTIKAMRLEKGVLGKYKTIYEDANAIFGKAVAVETVTTSGIRDFLSAVFLGISFIISCIYVSMGELSMGLLVTIISLLPRFYSGMADLVGADLSFKKQLAQYGEILSYGELQGEEGGSAVPDDFLRDSLDMKDVSYAYNDGHPVLKQLSLRIPKGTWTGIEGKSGIGKSTLMDLIIRLYSPSSGDLTLDDTPAAKLSLAWYRSHIAYVPQEPFLFSGTIRDNIALFCGGPVSDSDVEDALKGAYIFDFVMALPQKLDTNIGDNGVTMSGGEKQRLALAIALLMKRPLLLLDEATSNMDQESEKHVRQYLRERVDKDNLTILSISHRKAFHEEIDTVFIMDGSDAAQSQ